MTYAQAILPELEQELASTRKVLERVPEDKFDWRPTPTSNTLGWNANHIAELPGWGVGTLTGESFDFAPPGGERYQSPNFQTRRELLELFDRDAAALKAAVKGVSDADVGKPWSLLSGGQVIFTMPRAAVLRSFVISHMIHHRAMLIMGLRLNGIKVPGMYGPSGEEA